FANRCIYRPRHGRRHAAARRDPEARLQRRSPQDPAGERHPSPGDGRRHRRLPPDALPMGDRAGPAPWTGRRGLASATRAAPTTLERRSMRGLELLPEVAALVEGGELPPTLSVSQAARLYGVGTDHAYAVIREGN